MEHFPEGIVPASWQVNSKEKIHTYLLLFTFGLMYQVF